MNPALTPLTSPLKVTAASLLATPDVVRAAKQMLDRRNDASILVFDGRTSEPVDIDFRGSVDDVLARLPDIADVRAADEPMPRHRSARSRPSETGRGRARSHAIAAALGMAGPAIGRRLGRIAQTGRRGEADRRGQVSRPAGAGIGLSFHVCDGRQQAALRRRDPRAVRGDSADFEKLIAEWPADVRGHASALAERAFDREPLSRAG